MPNYTARELWTWAERLEEAAIFVESLGLSGQQIRKLSVKVGQMAIAKEKREGNHG